MELHKTLQVSHSLFTLLSQQFKLPFTFPMSTGAYKTALLKWELKIFLLFHNTRSLQQTQPSKGQLAEPSKHHICLPALDITFAVFLSETAFKVQHLGVIHVNYKPSAQYHSLSFKGTFLCHPVAIQTTDETVKFQGQMPSTVSAKNGMLMPPLSTFQ